MRASEGRQFGEYTINTYEINKFSKVFHFSYSIDIE